MPLLFDMPLEELHGYQGINPRPHDFDTFWHDSLNEMQSIDPDIEIIPAEFQTDFARCSHLYFTGTGGARVHARLLQPQSNSNPHPAVLMFHGYSGSAGDWLDKLGYVAMGYTVAALDCRGQGGLSEDAGQAPGWTLRGHIVRGLDGTPEQLMFRHVIYLMQVDPLNDILDSLTIFDHKTFKNDIQTV